MYIGIRLLLLIRPCFQFYSSSIFEILEFWSQFFSGTMRPTKLKLNTNIKNGLVYRVYMNIRLLILRNPFISSFFGFCNFHLLICLSPKIAYSRL